MEPAISAVRIPLGGTYTSASGNTPWAPYSTVWRFRRYAPSAAGVRRGAYIMADADDGKPDVLLLATGSEVALCLQAYEELKAEGIKARVVSMPSWEIFEYHCRKHPEYREHVLPAAVSARVSVEQGSTLGWARYVGLLGHTIGMEDRKSVV